jgi:dTDP-4-dehydrorhamnose 3,5-epimerase
MQINTDLQEYIYTQRYELSDMLDGVKFIDLKLHSDDGGYFLELLRLEQYPVKQVNYSLVMPGAIKAWHLHYKQSDIWFVPPGNRLLVGLRDCRIDSDTSCDTMRFIMGDAPKLLIIPPGVAHGCANVGSTPSSLIYFVTETFDIENPDEQRLEWDFFGDDFWKVSKG